MCKRRIITAITVSVVAAGIGCYFLITMSNPFWRKVDHAIKAGQTEVYLKDVTNFEWDSVCVLPPYALSVGGAGARTKQYIKADLGDYSKKVPLLNSDNAWAFAFIKNGIVVKIFRKGRSYYLRPAYNENCMPKEKARFVLSDKSVGYIDIID